MKRLFRRLFCWHKYRCLSVREISRRPVWAGGGPPVGIALLERVKYEQLVCCEACGHTRYVKRGRNEYTYHTTFGW